MTKPSPNDLIGATVTGITCIHDYIQLELDVAVVSLFNPLVGSLPTKEQAVGTKIRGIEIVDDHYMSIRFGDQELRMSLQSKDFTGPEAAEIYFNSGPIVVI